VARIVLVADDSPTIQKRAQGILKGEGFDVETVSNGVAAIKKLSKIQPVVVLADVSMPGKDGYEVCDFIKNSENLRHVPVLLVASDLEPYDEERGTRVRADGIIKKPFEPGELISTVMKLAAQAEAAAPQPETPQPVVASAEPAAEAPPVEEVPEMELKPAAHDLSSLSEGIAFAEPALEEMPAPVPAAAQPTAEPLMEAEVAAVPEPSVEAAAISPEAVPSAAAPGAEGPPIAAEPVLVEEAAAVPPEPSPRPTTEQTLMFRTPAEIAEPVFSDEVAPTPPAEEPPAAPVEAESAPVAATSLESFSLTEATTGQVRLAPLESEVAPPAEPVSAEPAAAVAAPLDPRLVCSIVHKVVAKMAPPVLPPQVVEEMASRLAEEIITEISPGSTQTQ